MCYRMLATRLLNSVSGKVVSKGMPKEILDRSLRNLKGGKRPPHTHTHKPQWGQWGGGGGKGGKKGGGEEKDSRPCAHLQPIPG